MVSGFWRGKTLTEQVCKPKTLQTSKQLPTAKIHPLNDGQFLQSCNLCVCVCKKKQNKTNKQTSKQKNSEQELHFILPFSCGGRWCCCSSQSPGMHLQVFVFPLPYSGCPWPAEVYATQETFRIFLDSWGQQLNVSPNSSHECFNTSTDVSYKDASHLPGNSPSYPTAFVTWFPDMNPLLCPHWDASAVFFGQEAFGASLSPSVLTEWLLTVVQRIWRSKNEALDQDCVVLQPRTPALSGVTQGASTDSTVSSQFFPTHNT